MLQVTLITSFAETADWLAATFCTAKSAAAFTIIVIVTVVAHCVLLGVKVYVPVAVLLIVEGLQLPAMPFNEVVGNTGGVEPGVIAGMAVNVGVTVGFTITINGAATIHLPAEAVKIYVPVTLLLITAGTHVPPIPLIEVDGNKGACEPAHIGPMAAKVAVVDGVTFTTIVAEVAAHAPLPTITK